MLSPFFHLAMLSPGRQRTFRRAVVAHLLVLTGGAWVVLQSGGPNAPALLGQVLLIAGIVEGAVLIGWRLAQMPKSKALEFLLVSPLRPQRLLLAEAAVGVGRLALVTLSGLPVLGLLVVGGRLEPVDLMPLVVMPFTWGMVTGLGLTTWAYEPSTIRRWAERVVLALVVFYLAIGVLVGEHLTRWLAWLPQDFARLFQNSFEALHRYNPFAVVQYWLEEDPGVAWERALGLEIAALATVGLLLLRSSGRLKEHFHERHYRPVTDDSPADTAGIGNRPLAWWAVRRVMEYSGRANLWLAGGFGVLYAAFTVAGPHWPDWMGRRAFEIFGQMGGIPAVATALVVLAAVPAAFQYGLWDSNAQDRCRRLELLMLTELAAEDYWDAAAAAAWRRGRGYFGVAVLLWAAAAVAGQATVPQVVAALAASVILWGLYFAIGFRAFSRRLQANGLGSLLTLGLPVLTLVLYQVGKRFGWPEVAALVPPGGVYLASSGPASWAWLPGPVLAAVAALAISRYALAHCTSDLRRWYELHHGQKVVE
jgi:hypothetical protein